MLSNSCASAVFNVSIVDSVTFTHLTCTGICLQSENEEVEIFKLAVMNSLVFVGDCLPTCC